MIRVVYHWKVEEGAEETFARAWTEVTLAMRESFEGARGSLLLRSRANDSEFLTVARWDNFVDWQQFHDGPRPHPEAFQQMVISGELIATEFFDEIEELTIL